ncbi:hypothetical protein D3C71_79730 [compost metagenome]
MTFISRLLNRANPHSDLEIKFHKEANHFGEHGQLKVTHVKQGLKGANIRFVFPGLAEAPALTRVMLDHIWESARAQGYVPHELIAYGNENILIKNDSRLQSNHQGTEASVSSKHWTPSESQHDVVQRVLALEFAGVELPQALVDEMNMFGVGEVELEAARMPNMIVGPKIAV